MARRAVIVVIAGVLCTATGFAVSVSSAMALRPHLRTMPVRVISPSEWALVPRGTLRVVVAAPAGWRLTSAWLERRAVTRMFHRSGARLVGRIPAGDLRLGSDHLQVLVTSGRRRALAAGRFYVARRDRRLLAVTLAGGPGRPIHVQVATRDIEDEFRAWLNGHRIDRSFFSDRARHRVADLAADDGLRFGWNVLTVEAWRHAGTYDIERRRFFVGRSHPLAGARDVRASRGRRVQLDGGPSVSAGRAPLSYHWRILSRPRHSRARLHNARARRPWLVPDRPGTYRLELTVRQRAAGGSTGRASALSPAGQAFVTVNATDTVPPIGFSIDTAAPGVNGIQIIPAIGAASCAGTIERPIILAIVARANGDRQTQGEMTCVGTYSAQDPQDPNLKALQSAIDALPTDHSELAIVSIPTIPGLNDPVDPSVLGTFNSLVAALGGEPYASGQIPQTGGLSLIGSHGFSEGAAWQNTGLVTSPAWESPVNTPPTTRPAGDLNGWLEQSGDPLQNLTFVSADYVPFDTSVQASPNTNTMKIGRMRFPAHEPLPKNGVLGGFELVVLDAGTLKPVQPSMVFPTNNVGEVNDALIQQTFAQELSTLVGDPTKIVLLQSIGSVRPTTSWFWSTTDGIAGYIAQLGGNFDVVNRLTGSGTYTLVGGGGMSVPAEASSSLGEGAHLSGVLRRDHSMQYTAEASDPFDAQLDSLLAVAYQPATAFPSGTGPRCHPQNASSQSSNALSAITTALFPRSSVTNVRTLYWQNTDQDWIEEQSSLQALTYSGFSHPQFSQCIFANLQKSLYNEFAWAAAVQTYFGSLITGVSGSNQQLLEASVDAQVNQILDRMVISSNSKVFTTIFSILGDVVQVLAPVAAAPPSTAAPQGTFSFGFLGNLSGAMELIGALGAFGNDSPSSGPIETAATSIQDDMTQAIQNSYFLLSELEGIVMSDYGKLRIVGLKTQAKGKGSDGNWLFNASSVPAMFKGLVLGTGRWAAAELVPQDYYMADIGNYNPASSFQCSNHYAPFGGWPSYAQAPMIAGFTGPSRPSMPIYATKTIGYWGTEGPVPPPASLMQPLFAPQGYQANVSNSGTTYTATGLGLHRSQFFMTAPFGTLHGPFC